MSKTREVNALNDYWLGLCKDIENGNGQEPLSFAEFLTSAYYSDVVNDIKSEVNESIVTGDLTAIIYNLEQMDFTAEEILYRLEEALKGYTFELDTDNGDTITLKGSN